MPGDVSTRTFETEEYSPDDWSPVLKPFEEHASLTPLRPDEFSLEDYLHHEENRTGGNLSYLLKDQVAELHLTYSPYLRSEHGTLLKGYVVLKKEAFEWPMKDWKIHSIDKMGFSGLKSNTVSYIKETDLEEDLPEIARIEVLELAGEEEVETTLTRITSWVDSIAYRNNVNDQTVDDSEIEEELRELLEESTGTFEFLE